MNNIVPIVACLSLVICANEKGKDLSVNAVTQEEQASVYWAYKENAQIKGNGTPIDIASAKASVVYANDKYPQIHHWLVPVTNFKQA